MNERKYKTEIIVINSDQPLRLETNAFTLYNTGSTNAQIDSFVLVPGATYSDVGHWNEMNISQYNISFTGGTGELLLFRKKYID